MPTTKQSNSVKYVIPSKGGWVVRGASTPVQGIKVYKGKSSAATKEAVKSNAERHREAMIRLADR